MISYYDTDRKVEKPIYNYSIGNPNNDYDIHQYKKKTSYVPNHISLINVKEIEVNFDRYINNFYNENAKIEYILDGFWIQGKHKIKIEKKVIDVATTYAIEIIKEKIVF